MQPNIMLIGAAAAIAYLALRGGKKKSRSCSTTPFEFDRAAVVAAADVFLDQGRRDPSLISVDVATKLYPVNPSTKAPVVWPPTVPVVAAEECLWGKINMTVLERMAERGMVPGEDPVPAKPIIFDNGDPYAPGYPWNRPLIENTNYPTPGMFFLVGEPVGDKKTMVTSLDRTVQMALGSALAMAGRADLLDWVKPSSDSYFDPNAKRLRAQMRRLITYSPWNDKLYGQTDKKKAGGTEYAMEPCGRGLNWYPYHADNIGRMGEGKAPLRTTDLSGNRIIPGAASQMQLWIPAVNLAALGPNVPAASLAVTTQGMTWPDGNSTLVPPPVVYDRGIESPVAAATEWGCAGVE